MSDSAPVFPVFLKLADRRVVVVGGGRMAATKIPFLLEAGAQVTVVAPDVSGDIDPSTVTIVPRRFEPDDLDGAWYVVAAAPPDVNRAVARAADSRHIFVNAVDDPAHATAYAGSVLRRGGVTVAISSDGQAPALTGLLREAFDALLPRELETWMAEARRERARWRRNGVPVPARRPLLLTALNRLHEHDD